MGAIAIPCVDFDGANGDEDGHTRIRAQISTDDYEDEEDDTHDERDERG